MTINTSVPQEKKLTIIFRVESGCLGPTGHEHVDAFCVYAQKAVESTHSNFIHWQITPRNNSSEDEMEYIINGKKLSDEQAKKYMALFDTDFDEFDHEFHDKITVLIEQYLGQ